MKTVATGFCLAILALTGTAVSATIDAGGFPTIQEALNAAGPEDVVVVPEGMYEESLLISTDGITLRGVGDVHISGPLHDPLTGDSALRVNGVAGVLVEDINFASKSGGIQVDAPNRRTIGYYSLDAISIVDAQAVLRRVTATAEGALHEADGARSASLDAVESLVTLENCTLTGATGTPRMGNDYTQYPVKATVGGYALQASGGRTSVDNSVIQGGTGGAGVGSRYGSASMSGGSAAALDSGAHFDFRDTVLRAGDTPQPGFWTVGYGSAGAPAPALQLATGAIGNLTDVTFDVAQSYSRGEDGNPFILTPYEGQAQETSSDAVIAGTETHRFAEIVTLLAARPSLGDSLTGTDGIIDAADLLASGKVVLPFPWWE